jgi:beta-glucanase (GH16 family)
MTIGLGIGGMLCYFAYNNVPRHTYCLIMNDNFLSGLDSWNYEIQLGGFGVGTFDWTTNDPANTYVDASGLHIVPTLTTDVTDITEAQLEDGYTLDLTSDGSCTSGAATDCIVTSNATSGIIIPPVRSARITTKGKKYITYGRIEVVAKMPAGSWLWPAIWMMPEDSVYGQWPKSGEIDIVESRGNDPATYGGGRDTASSALHWGLTFGTDMFRQTFNSRSIRRTDYSKAFHTYGIEWSEKYMYTYIDNRLQQILYVDFSSGQSMWTRSGLANMGYSAENPWSQTARDNTPFDQAFYLILNVAVGGTGGYFLDGVGGKPWVDYSFGASARDFWRAKDSWYPTWGAGDAKGMTVKNVKMWQQGACTA